jgi:hypothetical protein
MLDGAKQKMAERMMSQVTPSETPIAQAAIGTLTEFEARQTSALVELVDAADLDIELRFDREQRAQFLLGLVDAIAERRVTEWWFEAVGPEVLEQPALARQYIGVERDEWHDQLRRWYQSYHDAGLVEKPIEEVSPGRIGEVADRHVRETFGLSLPEFVATVVNWSRGEQIQPILGGPIERNNQVIREVAEEIDDT